MEEEQRQPMKLFAFRKDSPMQFSIILKHLLAIEVERVLKHIDEQGGEFMGFDPEDNKYINLASSKYKAQPNQIVIDIKYVKRCVKEKRLMNLNAFQISGPESSGGPGCMPLYDLLEMKKCEHCQTPEEVLSIIMGKRGKNRDG